MAGLYIHVPFCVKRCIYCDFYSNTDMSLKEGYISALEREMAIRNNFLHGETVETIYFGGGTPSQLQYQDFLRIFECISKNFPVLSKPEITVEANPDDLSDAYVGDLRKLPFNRISIGIQSFSDEDLRLLNRRHTAEYAASAVKRCQDAGFFNISIDLIYGLPNQTENGWESNIRKAISLNVPHISAYSLTYEEGTAIYKMLRRGEINPVEDERSELFFNMLIDMLESSDYVHYEISNFAKRTSEAPDGLISKHNSSYWNGKTYIGLGPAAHSYRDGSRSWNVSSISEYIKFIGEKGVVPREEEYLDAKSMYNDYVITRLRTAKGLSLAELANMFGEDRRRYFLKQSEQFVALKMLKIDGDIVKIERKGLFISDAIMRELIAI